MASSAPSGICGKCGVNKKSGKRSCCFRGGDWFENCGTNSETQFDHTWLEGIQACTARSRIFPDSSMLSPTGCSRSQFITCTPDPDWENSDE